ncbi:MauE/DoxX family redox-associated membrane protein [Mycobacterium interjectum]|uniref:MauE/DoxX family redox-associated membrane protein n=1 Tax=Mycobacterium interjectum TaxID=33895 RepID=UPI0035565A95
MSDRGGARRAVTAFGVPRAAAAFVGPALIASEFGIAALLVAEPRTGGAAALLALAGFSVVALVSLARGRAIECHCFGRLSSAPLGWPTLARNGCFAALAASAALDGRFGWALTAFAVVALGLWLGPAARRRWTSRSGGGGRLGAAGPGGPHLDTRRAAGKSPSARPGLQPTRLRRVRGAAARGGPLARRPGRARHGRPDQRPRRPPRAAGARHRVAGLVLRRTASPPRPARCSSTGAAGWTRRSARAPSASSSTGRRGGPD